MSKRTKSDADLLSKEDIDAIEASMPTSAQAAQAELLKLSQGGKAPTFVKVYRRKGLGNALVEAVRHGAALEAPYRYDEPALVLVTESVKMESMTVACWLVEYLDTINGEYPRRVELPIEEYVWRFADSSKIGKKWHEFPGKGA